MATLVGHDGNYCCLPLTRGFERIHAAIDSSAAYDTDASVSCEKTVDATGGMTAGDKTTCPLQWTEHGTLRLCANSWCAASTYSMEQKPTRTCSKKAHTEARDARCLHGSELMQSIFSTYYQGRCAHRAGSRRPGSQTVTKKPVS